MKQEKKEQRKTRIIQEAKRIVLEDGFKDVSARKIGEACNISYATIYNYFKDINELMAHVSIELLQDSYDYVSSKVDQSQTIRNQIKSVSDSYYEYMTDNPNRFKIVFIQDYGSITNELSKQLVPKVGLLLKGLLDECPTDCLKLPKELIFELLASSIHAKLMFQVFKRTSASVEDDKLQLKTEIDELILC